MAESFQNYVQPSNYSPTPVVTKLGGKGQVMEAVAGLAKAGIEGYVEYDKQNQFGALDQKLAELNDEYFKRDPASTQAEMNVLAQERAALDMDMRKVTEIPYFQTGEEATERYEQLSGAASGLDAQLSKLQAAKEQGAMSSFEYDQRAKKLTRELVAANPHLSRELLGRLSQNLNLSGMEERIKYDEALRQNTAKAYADEEKNVKQELEKNLLDENNYVDSTGAFDVSAAKRANGIRRTQKLTYELAKESLANKENFTKLDAIQLRESKAHYSIADGALLEFRGKLAELRNQFPDYAQFKTQAAVELARAKTNFTSQLGGKVKYDPEIELVYNQTLLSMDDIAKVIDSSESGETYTKYMENKEKLATLIETNNLRERLGSLEAIRLQNQLMSSQAFIKILDEDKGLAVKVLERLIDVSKGARLTVEDSMPNKVGGASIADIVRDTTAKNVVATNGTGNDATIFNTALSDNLKVVNAISDQQDRFNKSQTIISNLGTKEGAAAAAYLSPENKAQLEAIIKQNNAPLFASIVSNKEKGVQFTFTPDGLITTTSADTAFRTSVVDRVNDSLKAYATLKGTDTKTIAQEFYSTFYKDTFDNKDIPKVDYMAQAKAKMPSLALQESGGKFYDKNGQYIVSPVGAFGKYQIMPMTGLRPSFGVKPLNYNLQGAAFDKDQERFATEYFAANLKHFNGDEKKALAGYNWGHGNVDKLVKKYGEDWFIKGTQSKEIPKETVGYVNALSSKTTADVGKLVASINTEVSAIEKNHPQVASSMFKTNTEKAKFIAERLNEEHGLNVTYEQVAQMIMKPEDKLAGTGNPLTDLASVIRGKNAPSSPVAKQASFQQIEADARAIKNSPKFDTLTKEEQNQVMTILDPALEGVYPEALLPVGKVVGALATRLGLRKAVTKAEETVVRKVPTARPIKELMQEQAAKSTVEQRTASYVARAAEKVARDRAKPLAESKKRIAERVAEKKQITTDKRLDTRAANKAVKDEAARKEAEIAKQQAEKEAALAKKQAERVAARKAAVEKKRQELRTLKEREKLVKSNRQRSEELRNKIKQKEKELADAQAKRLEESAKKAKEKVANARARGE